MWWTAFLDFRRVVRYPGLFAGIAAAACLVPAVRATRVDPAVVLRKGVTLYLLLGGAPDHRSAPTGREGR